MPDIFEAPEETQPKKTGGEKTAPVTPTATKEPLMSTSAKPTVHTENHMHSLASFCQNPQGFHFVDQHENEQVLLLLRAHFVTNLPWIILTVFFAFLPIVLSIVLPSLSPNTLFFFLPNTYIAVLFSFYYLILFSYAFVSFITWFYNIFFVTTERVIDIDFSNVVYHNVAATKIDLVEDVDYSQVGFLPTLFDFGTVSLNTASSEALFEAVNVPHPTHAVTIIGEIIGENP